MILHTRGQFRDAGSRARLWSVGGQQTYTEAVQTCKNMQTTQKSFLAQPAFVLEGQQC